MRRIKLTQGKYALVDDWNYEWLNKWKWFYGGRGYAVRNASTIGGKQKQIFMHRLIMNTPEGMDTDHEDGDGCNNQEYNLRECTHAQNQMNMKSQKNSTSKYKGVCWHIKRKRWRVQIKLNYKNIHIGYFTCEKEAAKAYDKKAKELFGEFARLNFKEG